MTSQVVYIIEGVLDDADEKSLQSAEFRLFETDVCFKLPKLCLPFNSTSVVANGFIYVLKYDGDIDRLETCSLCHDITLQTKYDVVSFLDTTLF